MVKKALSKYIGNQIFKKSYKEKLFIVNFHEKNHKNIAYEFFLKTGPLAILPMKKKKIKIKAH